VASPLRLVIDFETRSRCNLKDYGAAVYAEHPSTSAICAIIRGEGRTVAWTPERLDGLVMPAGVDYEYGLGFLRALVTEDRVVFAAHNAPFDAAIWEICLGLPPPLRWHDTMASCGYYGYPFGLGDVGRILYNVTKKDEGKELISRFSKPDRQGNLRPMSVADYQAFINYAVQDVYITYRLTESFGWELPGEEQAVFAAHWRSNWLGMRIDTDFSRNLLDLDSELTVGAVNIAVAEVRRFIEEKGVAPGFDPATQLSRVALLQAWINRRLKESEVDWFLDKLTDDVLEDLTDADDVPADVKAVAWARQASAKASMKKVRKALLLPCGDGRARFQIRYYGATRTGRFSGAGGLQPHNFARPVAGANLVTGTTAVLTRDMDLVRASGSTTKKGITTSCRPDEVLKSVSRGIIVPEPGNIFVVADWAQVEARGVLWLAEDTEALKEFVDSDNGTGNDVYCNMASRIYGRTITKADEIERTIGKCAVLGAGYGMGWIKFSNYTENMGIDLGKAGVTAEQVITAYRERYRSLSDRHRGLWARYQQAMDDILIDNRRTSSVPRAAAGRCAFEYFGKQMRVRLPCGRVLHYHGIRKQQGDKGWDEIVYESLVKGESRGKSTQRLWGSKATENISQAICRTLLGNVLAKADAAGWEVPLHVHDEVVIETTAARAEEAKAWLEHTMSVAPAWAKGFPLKAEAKIKTRYGK
jgi:DNA polymerase